MQGRWVLFLVSGCIELAGLLMLVLGIVELAGGAAGAHLTLLGFLVFALSRALLALAAARSQLLRPGRTPREEPAPIRDRPLNALVGGGVIVVAYGLTLWRFAGEGIPATLAKFPAPAKLAPAVAKAIDQGVDWSIVNFAQVFDAVRLVIAGILNIVELAFVATPWPVIAIAILLLAWKLAGRATLIFTAAALAYLGLFGLWEKSMATLALMATAVLVCVACGLPLGVVCAKSRRTNAVVEPILDVMQTLPTLTYLLPIIAFFSIGKVPGILATVIFALPPIIRLTALGIIQVPEPAREAALSLGASRTQLLFKVEMPLALRSILTGVNQTIMMSLSMVVIAAYIGAGGLGYDVFRAINFLQTGQGLLVGFAIVLVAMVLDRIVRRHGTQPRRRTDRTS